MSLVLSEGAARGWVVHAERAAFGFTYTCRAPFGVTYVRRDAKGVKTYYVIAEDGKERELDKRMNKLRSIINVAIDKSLQPLREPRS